MEYVIKITNKWTDRSWIYPKIYESEKLANNAILSMATKNNKYQVKPLN